MVNLLNCWSLFYRTATVFLGFEWHLYFVLNLIYRILVIDRAVSFGNAGQLAIEIQAELFANKVEVEFHQKIMGLGGMDVTYVDIATEVEHVLKEE